MRALTWQGREKVSVETVPDPTLEQPTDVIIRVTSTATCGSDLHLYAVLGMYLDPGDILGHEAMGIVEEVGSGAGALRPGDRVVVPFGIACGTCWMCRRGLHSQCETTQVRSQGKGAALFGYTQLYGQVPGGQAEYLRVPQAQFGPVVVPDDGEPDERYLYLSDVLPTAWQAVEHTQAAPGGTVAVVGLGPIGIDLVPEWLEMARRHGVEVLDLRVIDDVVGAVRDLTDGRGVDGAIDAVGMEAHGSPAAAGAQRLAGLLPDALSKPMIAKVGVDRLAALLSAISLVRRGGTVSISGVYGGAVDPLPMMDLRSGSLICAPTACRSRAPPPPTRCSRPRPMGASRSCSTRRPLRREIVAVHEGDCRMTARSVDAVVIGAGPNGLVAANALVDAGWDVLVLEAQPEVGGAVRTAEVTVPGFRTDLFSAFYPLAAASPLIKGLHLGQHGLEWVRAPDVLAHALDDGRAAVLHADAARTAAGLEQFAAGDGEAWLRMANAWHQVRDPLLDALFTPFPPVVSVARLLRRVGVAGGIDLARLAVLPVRRLAAEQFAGEGAALLLTGNAMHADIPPDAAGSGVFGWLLAMLGQDVGFPVPRGGAGALANALVSRIVAGGGQIETGSRVQSIEVRGGRAVAVRTQDGTLVRARRAVVADVPAPALYRKLVGLHLLPARLGRDLDRFQWDHPTFKVNWALDSPVPWKADGARGAGTVHLGVDNDGFVGVAADLSTGRIPERPFLLFGQMTTTDPTRSPAGTESAWAYTHVPHAVEWTVQETAAEAERVEAAVERVAPGFRASVIGRHVQSPLDLEAHNENLVGGAVNGGTSALHQQLFFRPTPGLGRPETPIAGLFLASASAHPGGGVHGACGWNAARAALAAASRTGRVRQALARTVWERVLREP